MLFNTINSVLNPSATCSALPATVCDDVTFFVVVVQKINNISMQIVPGSFDSSATNCTSVLFNQSVLYHR